MKTTIITSLFFSICLTISAMALHVKTNGPGGTDPVSNPGFAVIELFTSEGCSSCPPADKLLARIQEENTGKPVYILAFHVDYWNHQGWRDAFSEREFTKRQYQYASWLNLETVYTPQVVINGKHELIGSQEETLKRALVAELRTVAPANLSAEARVDAGKLKLAYQTANAGSHTVVQVALVQKVAHTMVKRGENAGRLLPHVQIVRQIRTYPAAANGELTLPLPAAFNTQEWEVVAFLQNTQTGTIIAATRPEFKQNS